MSILTAVAEDSKNTKHCFAPLPSIKIDDGTLVVIMDMAVSGAVADRTGLQFRAEPCHKGVKENFVSLYDKTIGEDMDLVKRADKNVP